jgi:hypothetical protein
MEREEEEEKKKSIFVINEMEGKNRSNKYIYNFFFVGYFILYRALLFFMCAEWAIAPRF